MKQAIVKSIGVAALGAAFTAAVAGTAAAAPTDSLSGAASDVTRTLPALDSTALDSSTLDRTTSGTGDLVRSGTGLVQGATESAPLAADTLAHTKKKPTGGLTGVLGNLPIDPSGLGLPTDALSGVSLG
ncbi:ATP-binding protein [Streptomyces radicis]|uniref:ATP-binding protein n=1 Tax=Streptomyces radicis TaxID=1750517 RepID=UPI001603F657|nr:ATP-binding protein [Streptomyces radicis]